MNFHMLGFLLATTYLTVAQDVGQLRSTENLRNLLQDPNSDLAKLAKSMAGEKGGNQLFYFPTRDEPATPASRGYKFESVTFPSTDGVKLSGWFLPAKGIAPRKAKASVVFSHGNAGSIGHHLGFCTWLVDAGYNVMMYDYRGFGKSTGTVDRRGMINDVKAAFSHLKSRSDIDPSKLISFGHSLGGAQSITALAETPVDGLRAIIVDGAFASYQAMARLIGGQLGATLVTDELSPKDFVDRLGPVPLLVVHGTRDEVVPISHAKLLFDSAVGPKTLFEVKSGQHTTALSDNDGAYRRKMLSWLDQTLGQ